jgi:hypothetical protein
MDFSWQVDLPDSLKNALISRSSIFLPRADAVSLSGFLNGLRGVQYEWKNAGKIEHAVCAGFFSNFHRQRRTDKTHKGRELTNCIFYLGDLFNRSQKERNVMVLTKDVIESFWYGIEQFSRDFKPQEITNLLYGYCSVSVFYVSYFCFVEWQIWV